VTRTKQFIQEKHKRLTITDKLKITSIIILAAGASTRLGRTKQTLSYKGSSLLKHTIKVAIDSEIGSVLVVIGANEKEISAHIETEAVTIVTNKDYTEGIAASIRAGVNYVQEHYQDCEDIILMVCDQPYVDEHILKSLVNAKLSTNKPLAACVYKQTVGVPAMFDKRFFPELLSLRGEEGGKKILLEHQGSVARVQFPFGEIDIDTPADVDNLITD
jgi:molybdenum cofactor cytidylyltransferase